MANRQDVFKTIERLTTVLVLPTSILVLFLAGKQLIFGPPKPVELSSYRVGDSFPALPGLDLNAGGPALVLYVRSTCPYCTASMDFYRGLTALKPLGRRIVVVGAESKEVLRAYFAKYAVAPDLILSVPTGTLRISGTPTLLAVERSGAITHIWPGKLGTTEQESEVRSIVTKSIHGGDK